VVAFTFKTEVADCLIDTTYVTLDNLIGSIEGLEYIILKFVYLTKAAQKM
jgi:hypothetical protein